jgi:nucleotide-binding universal stress UspA family protein
MKLVVGYDGSEAADAALDDLARAGLPDTGQALIVAASDVWPQGEPALGPSATRAPTWLAPVLRDARAKVERERDNVRAMAAAAKGRLAGILPGWRLEYDAVLNSPRRAIVSRADSFGADLVVVGSRGRSGLAQLILGSVAQSVLTHAHCSVRVGRAHRTGDQRPVKILVGIDGSVGSATAVLAVTMRKWPAGSQARVVAVVDLAVETTVPAAAFAATDAPNVEETPQDWILEAAQQVSQELKDAGLDASPQVCQGDPKRVLVEQADGWDADCIFVGASGIRGVERFLLGSVSSAVGARAHCSVEVVRQPR